MRRLGLAVIGAAIAFGPAGVTAQEISPDGNFDPELTYDPPSYEPQYGAGDGGGGVDPATGAVGGSVGLVSIGDPSAGGLAYVRDFSRRDGRRDNFLGAVEETDEYVIVTAMGMPYRFVRFSRFIGIGTAKGADLRETSNRWYMTARDGTQYVFKKSHAGERPVFAPGGRLYQIWRTDGSRISLKYDDRVLCTRAGTSGASCPEKTNVSRLMSVNSSLGYQVKYQYAATLNEHAYDDGRHTRITRVTAINKAYDYCDKFANGCTSLTKDWPTVRFEYGGSGDNKTVTIRNALDERTRYTYDEEGRLKGVRYPSSGGGADDVTYTYHTNGRARTMTRGASTWRYSYAFSDGRVTTTIRDPNRKSWTVVSRAQDGQVVSSRNPLGQGPSYRYHTNGLVQRVTSPNGSYTTYDYDDRGNPVTVTQNAKGGALTAFTTTLSYPACTSSNRKYCNKPRRVTDWRGTTDYSYDATTGAVSRVELPDAGQGRHTTTITYQQVQARYKADGSGGEKFRSVWRPTVTRVVGGATTRITYEDQASGRSNAMPTVIERSGANALTARTTLVYDEFGNVTTTLGPLGFSDLRTRSYDALRRPVVTIMPRPTGSGSLSLMATKTSYDADGRIAKVARGKAPYYTAFDQFAELDSQRNEYDAHGRLSRRIAFSGGTHAAIDYAYDAKSRVTCVAYRMTALWSKRDACAASSGGFGLDRLVRYQYDDADRRTHVTTGYRSPVSATTRTGYRSDGQVDWVQDASGNRTTYLYDEHGRLTTTEYPTKNKNRDGVSSTTDYDRYVYHPTKNVVQSHRRRDGTTTTFGHDALGRVTSRNAPGWRADLTTRYDRLGRVDRMAGQGRTLTFGYDGLGQLKTAGGPLGTVRYDYDVAGRRKRMTYPGPGDFYVDYDHDALGALTRIREKGATSGVGVLAAYEYDQLGRRAKLTRGNGIVTRYGLDDASRLARMDITVPAISGTSNAGFGTTMTFQRNPAGQIERETSTNSKYVSLPRNDYQLFEWNGLNQITKLYAENETLRSAGRSLAYDDRGNMTSDGATSYGYDEANRLVNVGGRVSMSYDPVGRLHEENTRGTRLLMLYDDASLIAEHDASGGVRRRYVHGPGPDEVLVWYERKLDGTFFRRFLVADERGSVVLVTESNGKVLRRNRYTDAGIPRTNNLGRFGYTGQAKVGYRWDGDADETELWHYKARAYHPRLGRFVQADPIGYGDGMNLYRYASNDPVNATDPSGNVCENTGSSVDGNVVSFTYTCNSGSGSNSSFTSLGTSNVAPSTPSFPGGAIDVDLSELEEPEEKEKRQDECTTASPSDRNLPDFLSFDSAAFTIHYVIGRGQSINLGGVGLGDNFRSASSVSTAVGTYISIPIHLGLHLV